MLFEGTLLKDREGQAGRPCAGAIAALLRRAHGGGGDYFDVAMFDSTVAFMASAVVPYLVTGRALERTGNIGYSGQPTSAVFRAGDGRYLSLGVVQQRQFELLARLLDRERWLEDPRFADADARRANAAAMQAEIGAVLGTRDAAQWEAELSQAGVPCGMVRSVGEAVSLPGLDERSLRVPLSIPGLPEREQVDVLGLGVLGGQPDDETLGPPPRLGEHTEEVLAWLEPE